MRDDLYSILLLNFLLPIAEYGKVKITLLESKCAIVKPITEI